MADIKAVVEQQIAQDGEAFALPILQRNGKPYLAADGSRATISLVGSESTRYKKARDDIWRKTAESTADEDTAASRIAIAATAVTGWHGWEANGQSVDCTPDNVRALLSLEHILLQVEAGIGRRSSFFGDASVG